MSIIPERLFYFSPDSQSGGGRESETDISRKQLAEANETIKALGQRIKELTALSPEEEKVQDVFLAEIDGEAFQLEVSKGRIISSSSDYVGERFTSTETKLLYQLTMNSKRVVAYGQIFRYLWGAQTPDDPHNSLWTNISRVRKKLREISEPLSERLKTEYSGYIWEE